MFGSRVFADGTPVGTSVFTPFAGVLLRYFLQRLLVMQFYCLLFFLLPKKLLLVPINLYQKKYGNILTDWDANS